MSKFPDLDRFKAERKIKEQAVSEYQDRLMAQLRIAADIFTGCDRDSEVVRTVLSGVNDSIVSAQSVGERDARTVFGWVRSYLVFAGLVLPIDGDSDVECLKEFGPLNKDARLAPEPKAEESA